MIVDDIKKLVGDNNFSENVALKSVCTYGIGGIAKYFVKPTNFYDVFAVIDYADKYHIKYKIIGNASNILFSDDGFDGIIISTKNINSYALLPNNKIIASAGMLLSKLLLISVENSLTGLEFSVGIPATVGGAIYNNSGACGYEIKDIIDSVTFYENGKIHTKKVAELNFEYRKSPFTSTDAVIMFAEFKLEKCRKELIEETVNAYKIKRESSQPFGKSAGCVFKKCGEFPAGLLIDKAGLKGTKIGDAIISTKHANFFINTGSASASDIIKLIDIAKCKIKEIYNKELNLEIEVIE